MVSELSQVEGLAVRLNSTGACTLLNCRAWRPAIGELSIPMRQRDPSALPSLGLTKSRSPLKLIPQDGHQGDRAMSRNSPPRSRLFSRDDNKRSDAGFVCVFHLSRRLNEEVSHLVDPRSLVSIT